MRIQKVAMIFFVLMLSSVSFAEVIIQNGKTYSCREIESEENRPRPRPERECKETCVKYCSKYDKFPFEDRCRQYADKCGIKPSVSTRCAEYDDFPFEDRCLQREDKVSTSGSCD